MHKKFTNKIFEDKFFIFLHASKSLDSPPLRHSELQAGNRVQIYDSFYKLQNLRILFRVLMTKKCEDPHRSPRKCYCEVRLLVLETVTVHEVSRSNDRGRIRIEVDRRAHSVETK